MEAKTKEKSFVQAWKLNIWAWKLSYKEMPGWYISMFLNGCLTPLRRMLQYGSPRGLLPSFPAGGAYRRLRITLCLYW